IAGFSVGPESTTELAEAMRSLLRTRGNAWFVAFRSALAPAAMLQADALGLLPEAASEVVRDALDVVQTRGADAFRRAGERIGTRLAQSGVLGKREDMAWLEWNEACQARLDGGGRQAMVEARRAAAAVRPADS